MAETYENIIDRIQDILEEGKQSLSGGKVKVDKEAILECLEQLGASIPTEIVQARRIVASRDPILREANAKAEQIVQQAEAQAQHMTAEHQITERAKTEARSIIDDAQTRAQRIIAEANTQANATIANAEKEAENTKNLSSEFVTNIMNGSINFLGDTIDFLQGQKSQAESVASKLKGIGIMNSSPREVSTPVSAPKAPVAPTTTDTSIELEDASYDE